MARILKIIGILFGGVAPKKSLFFYSLALSFTILFLIILTLLFYFK